MEVDPAYTWSAIGVIVLTSTAGDIFTARAMKQVGHVGDLLRGDGLWGVVKAIFRNSSFLVGLCCMAVSFFSLLVALSWDDVSLIGPAAASLTFVSNAVAARIFLHEAVDRRRWISALLICAGVAVLAI